MTHFASKNTSNWTDKHTKFSIKYRLKYVATNLWKWFLTLPRETSGKIEFELKEFQKYIKNLQEKPFDWGWVKIQFDKLVFLRIIHIDKDFGHNTYRIDLRHPDAVIPKKRVERNSDYYQVSQKKYLSNDCNSETGTNSSSNHNHTENHTPDTENNPSSNSDNKPDFERVEIKEYVRRQEILKSCADYGILFNCKKRTTEEIYKYSLDDVLSALKLYQKRKETSKIWNPQGWLIECLRGEYWVDELFKENDFIEQMKEFYSSFIKPDSPLVT